MAVTPERRSEPRSTVHQVWNVRFECREFAIRICQVVDYSPSGMKLALDGSWDLYLRDQIQMHYLGTSFSCTTSVCWSTQMNNQTLIGVQVMNDPWRERQAD